MLHTTIRSRSSQTIEAAIRRDGGPTTQQRHFRAVESIATLSTVSTTVIDTITTPFTVIEAQLKGSNFQVHIAYSDVLLSDDTSVGSEARTKDSRLSSALAPGKGFIVADQFKQRKQAFHRPQNITTIKVIDETSNNITLPVRFAADFDILTYPNA